MKFDVYDVVYVEDQRTDWERLDKAVKKRNEANKSTPLRIKWAQSPEELNDILSLSTRLVLADVFFPKRLASGGRREERLKDIINYVKNYVQKWSTNDKDKATRLIPIIAYTSRGPAALKYCLDLKESLYDIWDKSAASPEYAAWRLSELSKELSRIRPDALTQRLIREMDPAASWHECVVNMTKRYDEGWSEQDQIERAGNSVKDIAFQLEVWNECGPLWNAMVDWEALSRAVSRRTRGHARHVINVFWLGYYLLNHENLRGLFAQYWEWLKFNRKNMGNVENESTTESICNSWFYAGLFHDVGGSVEKLFSVDEYQKKFILTFKKVDPLVTDAEGMSLGDFIAKSKQLLNEVDGELMPRAKRVIEKSTEAFMAKVQPWLSEFDDPLSALIKPVVEKSIHRIEPDQGVVAALYLRSEINKGKQECYAREGARAMSMHNLFPTLGNGTETIPITWEKEPLVCLLLLCDQLQTWDRERGTYALKDGDQPSRAELSAMEIELDGAGKPHINMSIDYIAPSHLDHSYELYIRVRDELVEILRKNPYRALNRIQKPWPFEVHVSCTLSGEPLETMHFGK